MNQTLRIIGGKFRGKKLSFPAIEGLRPTPDRVRETVFNWLMHTVKDARCLDAFAGSGALGFEAYSRGAKRVCFIEQEKTAFRQLQKNIQFFADPGLALINTDAFGFFEKTQETFDLIFLDPPFAKNLLMPALDSIAQRTLLAPEGLVYIESGTKPVFNAKIWEIKRLKKAGQVYYGLICKLPC